jgi:fructuronate reductase/mannitol 2-dehydrogenase
MPLNDRTLGHHGHTVTVPRYPRRSLTPAVVHVGVGSFHRSHQAAYFDEIAQRGISSEWGLVGIGLHRPEMGEALAAQDGLYTLVSRAPTGPRARVIGVMGRYLFAPHKPAAVTATLADPRTRLVTLTVTGAAYKIDPATGLFWADDPKVASDLRRPHHPRTAVGNLVEALDQRRRASIRPFTILSCDNMPANGATARTAVTSFARLRDERLAEWIEEHVAFPDSMVDRITPQTTHADRELVAGKFGIDDRWPVMTEPFSQWMIEDAFCNSRPPLDAVGAQFVPDVRPYSLMKTRMLNGSHCAIAYVGTLAGYRRIDEAVADPLLASLLDGMMRDEIAPLLDPVPGVDLGDYQRALLARFANRGIADRLSRLCRNGSSKMPSHIVSSIRAARAQGRPHARLTLAVAAWLRYLRGFDERGRTHEIDDPEGARLQALALAGGSDPRRVLAEEKIFGDLGRDERFVEELAAHLRLMHRDGVLTAVRAAMGTDAAAPPELAAA